MTAIDRYARAIASTRGWKPGSTLENRFIAAFNVLGVGPADLVQEHRVGRFRIDFADPEVLIGIEADGFYHRTPGAAERDARRDAWLLKHGWYIIRITDQHSDFELAERLSEAVQLIRDERQRQGRRGTLADAWPRSKPQMSVYAARLLVEEDRRRRAARRRRPAA